MSGAQRSAFELQMGGDPALKSLVNDQQLFIQSVSRKALLAEINSVAMTAVVATTAAGGSGFFGGTFWVVTSVVVVGGGTTAGLVYFNQDDETSQQQMAVVDETTSAETGDESTVSFTPTFDDEAENIPAVDGEDRAPSRESFVQPEPISDASLTIEINPVGEDSDLGDGDAGENSGLFITSDDNASTEFDGNNRTIHNNVVNARTNAKAEFTGGTRALTTFLKKIDYPETAKRRGIEARVKVEFWIDSEGKIEVLKNECIKLYDSETNEGLTGAASTFKTNLKKDFEEKVRHTMSIMDPWQTETDTYGNPEQSLQTWYFRFDIQDGIQFYNAADL